jgi:hypothetical protein
LAHGEVATDHCKPSYHETTIKTSHKKAIYTAIDDPLKPPVIATCKELIIDKPFERFAEADIRQLSGTNADMFVLRDLSALPSYGKLSPLQPILPMNFTVVLCEGHSGEQAPEKLAARHAETLLHSNEQRRDYVDNIGRFNHVCTNCECSDSREWHMDRDAEDKGDRYCYQCTAHHISYGVYPDEQDLERLAKKADLVASYATNPPPPGHCENPNCQQDGNSLWHWSTTHGFYLCDACKMYAIFQSI